MNCYYCDEPTQRAGAINLDGQLFCPDCAECTYCGKEAVTRRPELMCEACKEDAQRAADYRAKYVRLTEG